MAGYLPSEIARLVLGYLKEEGCQKSYSMFLKECIHLQEYNFMLKKGREYPTNIAGKSLNDMLDFYFLASEIFGSESSHDEIASKWMKFDYLVNELKILSNSNRLPIQAHHTEQLYIKNSSFLNTSNPVSVASSQSPPKRSLQPDTIQSSSSITVHNFPPQCTIASCVSSPAPPVDNACPHHVAHSPLSAVNDVVLKCHAGVKSSCHSPPLKSHSPRRMNTVPLSVHTSAGLKVCLTSPGKPGSCTSTPITHVGSKHFNLTEEASGSHRNENAKNSLSYPYIQCNTPGMQINKSLHNYDTTIPETPGKGLSLGLYSDNECVQDNSSSRGDNPHHVSSRGNNAHLCKNNSQESSQKTAPVHTLSTANKSHELSAESDKMDIQLKESGMNELNTTTDIEERVEMDISTKENGMNSQESVTTTVTEERFKMDISTGNNSEVSVNSTLIGCDPSVTQNNLSKSTDAPMNSEHSQPCNISMLTLTSLTRTSKHLSEEEQKNVFSKACDSLPSTNEMEESLPSKVSPLKSDSFTQTSRDGISCYSEDSVIVVSDSSDKSPQKFQWHDETTRNSPSKLSDMFNLTITPCKRKTHPPKKRSVPVDSSAHSLPGNIQNIPEEYADIDLTKDLPTGQGHVLGDNHTCFMRPGFEHLAEKIAQNINKVVSHKSDQSAEGKDVLTESKSLDAILNDEHTDIQDVIDMTRNDPAFDALFNIFNVDKNQFIEREYLQSSGDGGLDSYQESNEMNTPPHTPCEPEDPLNDTPIREVKKTSVESLFHAQPVTIIDSHKSKQQNPSKRMQKPQSKQQQKSQVVINNSLFTLGDTVPPSMVDHITVLHGVPPIGNVFKSDTKCFDVTDGPSPLKTSPKIILPKPTVKSLAASTISPMLGGSQRGKTRTKSTPALSAGTEVKATKKTRRKRGSMNPKKQQQPAMVYTIEPTVNTSASLSASVLVPTPTNHVLKDTRPKVEEKKAQQRLQESKKTERSHPVPAPTKSSRQLNLTNVLPLSAWSPGLAALIQIASPEKDLHSAPTKMLSTVDTAGLGLVQNPNKQRTFPKNTGARPSLEKNPLEKGGSSRIKNSASCTARSASEIKNSASFTARSASEIIQGRKEKQPRKNSTTTKRKSVNSPPIISEPRHRQTSPHSVKLVEDFVKQNSGYYQSKDEEDVTIHCQGSREHVRSLTFEANNNGDESAKKHDYNIFTEIDKLRTRGHEKDSNSTSVPDNSTSGISGEPLPVKTTPKQVDFQFTSPSDTAADNVINKNPASPVSTVLLDGSLKKVVYFDNSQYTTEIVISSGGSGRKCDSKNGAENKGTDSSSCRKLEYVTSKTGSDKENQDEEMVLVTLTEDGLVEILDTYTGDASPNMNAVVSSGEPSTNPATLVSDSGTIQHINSKGNTKEAAEVLISLSTSVDAAPSKVKSTPRKRGRSQDHVFKSPLKKRRSVGSKSHSDQPANRKSKKKSKKLAKMDIDKFLSKVHSD